jgi:hypothetical protein
MVELIVKDNPDYLQAKFRVNSITPVQTKVEWVLEEQPDTCEVAPVEGFNLYYNEVPNRFLVKLNDEPIATTTFTHNTAKYSKFPRGYYQIEGILPDGSTLKSRVFDIYHPFDRTGSKMSKEFMFFSMMRHGRERIDNIPVYVFARKGFGTDLCKCAVEGFGPLKSKCPDCLGTGFKGGFQCPVLSFVVYGQPFGRQETHTGPRKAQESTNMATAAAEICMINPNDYYREILPPFRLFCVENVQATEYNGRPVLLNMVVQQEESAHPLWQKDLPPLTLPDNIYYRDVRETYETIVDSIGRESRTSFK